MRAIDYVVSEILREYHPAGAVRVQLHRGLSGALNLECPKCGTVEIYGFGEWLKDFEVVETVKRTAQAHWHLPPKPLKRFERARVLVQMRHRRGALRLL